MIGEEDLILDEVLGEPEDMETLLAKIRQVGHRLTELTPEELAEQYGFTEEELDCVSLCYLFFVFCLFTFVCQLPIFFLSTAFVVCVRRSRSSP